ncbi:MAG: hypothetical protein R3C14_06225 [Caldilineaceae bacterium]
MNTNSSPRNWSMSSIMHDMVRAWQLFWDPSVPGMLKLLLPVAAIVYWLSPIDLMPGMPFDDIAVLILALRLFAQMADTVAPNQGQRTQGPTSSHRATSGYENGQVIDTTWRVVDE